jgi:hypothetical protein
MSAMAEVYCSAAAHDTQATLWKHLGTGPLRGQPVGLLVFAGRFVLDQQRQSAVGIHRELRQQRKVVEICFLGDGDSAAATSSCRSVVSIVVSSLVCKGVFRWKKPMRIEAASATRRTTRSQSLIVRPLDCGWITGNPEVIPKCPVSRTAQQWEQCEGEWTPLVRAIMDAQAGSATIFLLCR